MLNIKNCFFSYPKTYIKAINYDSHEYKDNRLKKDSKLNVELVNNVELFEAELNAYKQDLRASYKVEKHNKLKKTDKEINKIFNTSKVMRSFRISCNHIELNMLHKPNDSEEQKRQNIINFYSDVLDQFQDLLNKNNKFGKEVQIVKADLHFDQTSPHLHIHVSNLYEREVKKLNRKNVVTCNRNISDLIMILNKQCRQIWNDQKLKVSPNEVFTQYLRKINKDYSSVNKIDLKKLFPKQYNIFKLMQDADIVEKDWRLNKERYFHITKANLVKVGLSVDHNNDINNTQKLNDLTYYCFIQSLFKELVKDKNNDLNEINKKLNDNEFIAKLIDKSNEVYKLEKSLIKFEIKNQKLNQEKEQLVKKIDSFKTISTSKDINDKYQLTTKLEKINSLVVKNDLDKKDVLNELEHHKALNNSSDLIKNFIKPDDLLKNEALNNICLNLSYFKPELKEIEKELLNCLLLENKERSVNKLDYSLQISNSLDNPLKTLELHLDQTKLTNNKISNDEYENNKLNNKDFEESYFFIDLSENYNTKQHFKKNRTLKDIEREEELKKQREHKKHI